MNQLDLAVKAAIETQGLQAEANKAYLEFIKANFIIPVDINSQADAPEVLFLQDNGQVFMPVFSDMDYLNCWAAEIRNEIQILRLSGVDLLKGIGDDVFVCLNLGSSIYKEFNPSEISRMRSMVLKLFK